MIRKLTLCFTSDPCSVRKSQLKSWQQSSPTPARANKNAISIWFMIAFCLHTSWMLSESITCIMSYDIMSQRKKTYARPRCDCYAISISDVATARSKQHICMLTSFPENPSRWEWSVPPPFSAAQLLCINIGTRIGYVYCIMSIICIDWLYNFQ